MTRMAGFRCFLAVSMLAIGAILPAQQPLPAQQRDSRSDIVIQQKFDSLIAGAKANMLSNPSAAKTGARQAFDVAFGISDMRRQGFDRATARWLEGEADLRLDNIDAAIPLIDEAYSLVEKNARGSKLHADILLSRGGIRAAKGDAGLALKDYQYAYQIQRSHGDARSQSITLTYIAALYNHAMDGQNALRYYREAFDTYSGDTRLSAIVKNNLGNALKNLNRFGDASREYQESYYLTKNLGSPNLEVGVLVNLADVKIRMKDVAGAERAVGEAEKIAKQNSIDEYMPQLTVVEARIAFDHGDVIRAVALTKRAFAGVDIATTTQAFHDAHEFAYNILNAAHEPALALAHLIAMKRLDDAATKLATSSSTALMAARFDFANQELKIAKLKASELQRSIDDERARIQTQRMVFAIVGVATALIIAMLGFALVTSRRSRDRVRAANADLAITNTALGKALAAKTEFLATTSHEIRTPLNGILGMAQVMLADKTLADDVRERITVVHGAGLTMRALVDDILDVAKIETGNLTIEAAPFDLKATIAEASLMWEAQAEAKGVGFVRLLDDCPTMIEGDAARVRQIVFNLVSNALKFTAKGSVGLRATATGDGRFAIAVTDTGIGIPAAKREEIFESFRQADAGTTRQFGGTGLGLAICRNLARAMGGDVSVDSVEGQGSTFTVSLPLVEASLPQSSAIKTAEGEPGLLVLDRNPINRSMFRTLLSPHVGAVLFAASDEEAAACIRSGMATGVLIDDATMRASDDPFAAIRVVTTAAREAGVDTTLLWPISDLPQRDELMKAGVDSIVAKPVSGAALVAALFKSGDKAVTDLRAVSQAA